MTKRELLDTYKQMDDRRAFNCWLVANAVVGSIFATALGMMALAGSNSAGPREAVANSVAATEFISSAGRIRPGAAASSHGLAMRWASGELPLKRDEGPF